MQNIRINNNFFIIFDQYKYEMLGHYRTKLLVAIPHKLIIKYQAIFFILMKNL